MEHALFENNLQIRFREKLIEGAQKIVQDLE
jgi:hypothetical protein